MIWRSLEPHEANEPHVWSRSAEFISDPLHNIFEFTSSSKWSGGPIDVEGTSPIQNLHHHTPNNPPRSQKTCMGNWKVRWFIMTNTRIASSGTSADSTSMTWGSLGWHWEGVSPSARRTLRSFSASSAKSKTSSSSRQIIGSSSTTSKTRNRSPSHMWSMPSISQLCSHSRSSTPLPRKKKYWKCKFVPNCHSLHKINTSLNPCCTPTKWKIW